MKVYRLNQTLIIFKEWLTKNEKLKILTLFILSLLVAILEIVCLIVIQPLISLINQDSNIPIQSYFSLQNSDFTFLLGSIFVFLLILTSFLKVKTISYGHSISSYIGQALGIRVLRNFLGQNYKEHKSRPLVEVINTFTHHLTQSVNFLVFFLEFTIGFVTCSFISTFIIFKNPLITIGTFISVAFGYFLIAKNYKSRILKSGQITKDSIDGVSKVIEEITRNIENTILNYDDVSIIKDFSKSDKSLRESIAKVRNYSVLPKYIIEGIGICAFSIFTVFYIFILKPDNIQSSEIFGTLGTLVFGMQKLLPSVNTIYTSWSKMNAYIPSVLAVKNLISINIENRENYKYHSKNIEFKESIELENISFNYENKNILENVSLKIKKGDKFLIKGNSGSGKTTLVHIIMTLLFPDSGKLKIDNATLENDEIIRNWRRQIGYVKQKPYLKSGRIVDLFSNKKLNAYNKSEVLKKAKFISKLVCIDKFIEKLPNKYFEYISEDGSTLSGGQIQRIALGLSIASNPSLLIMDESTTGLEKEIEYNIFENLQKIQNLTLLVISHSKDVEKLFNNKIIL